MAAYTSTQSGNWNDVATWGGGGYPSLAGDTATISAGHTVTYNVVSTVELGAITVSGLLKFLETASTKLTLGNVSITVNSGGELRVGDSTTVIGSSYLAELIWNTTTDNAQGITINDGGKLTVYGDPAYYGSDSATRLALDWNSNATDTFTMVGNYTSKWQVGQEITVHKFAAYSSYTTDTALFTIAAITLNGSNTDIQVSGGIPSKGTFYTKGRVTNVSRNVKLYKFGASTVIGNFNTNRPRINDLNAVTNYNCVISNCQITGFYQLGSNYNFKFLNSVIRNGERTVFGNPNAYPEISGFVYSMNNAFYIMGNLTCSAEVYACYIAINYVTDSIFTGDSYGNATMFGGGTCIGSKFSGNIYCNRYAFNISKNVIINKSARLFKNTDTFYGVINNICYGILGYDFNDVSTPNSTDVYFGSSGKSILYLRGAKLPAAGLVFSDRNPSFYTSTRGVVLSENHGQVNGASWKYEAYGDIKKNTSVLRTGGADNTIEVVPLSNCAKFRPLPILDYLNEWVETAVPASAQTRTIKIKCEAWTVWPDATELWFEAEYISNATTLETTIVKSTAVLTDNTTWVDFSVSFTPAVAGVVRYRAYLGKYQASAKVYIDNRLY